MYFVSFHCGCIPLPRIGHLPKNESRLVVEIDSLEASESLTNIV